MATHYYELRPNIAVAGNFTECVFNYRIIDPTETNDYRNAEQLLAATQVGGPGVSWLSDLQGMMSEDAFISTISAKRIAPTGGNSARHLFQTDDLPGSVAEPVEAIQVAACIIWLQEVNADITGRNFIPGVPTTFLDGSRWNSDGYDAAAAFIEQHLVGFSTLSGIFEPVIFDRETKTGNPITDGYLSPRPGTQRRREVPL